MAQGFSRQLYYSSFTPFLAFILMEDCGLGGLVTLHLG